MSSRADIQEIIINTSFANLGLSAELLRAVTEQGYTTPTPIQAQAIPVVLAGSDLLGAAQTGTGKTAGFALPLLQRLAAQANASHSPARHPVRALIVVPTRELAAQVQESVRAYGRHLKLRSTVIFGGVGINPQFAELRRGTDIVVATPGRLLDHVQQRTIDLRQVQILVLDEADRMLDMGFIPDIRRILALLPATRQNLLFSATFPEEIRKLAGSFMRNPVTVEVAPRNRPIELVSQVVHPVDKDRKRELLAHLVKTGNWQQVLVFTKTKHGANRLAQQLERDGIESDAIHGNKSQGARTRALKRFKDNELQVLVATDIASRGLDIEELPHVVNYDLPNVPEDYVHRIGRTGRAGLSGQAVSLVCGEDQPLLAAIERLIGRRIEQQVVAGFEPGQPHRAPAARDSRPRQGQQQPRRQHGDEPAGRDSRRHGGQHQQPGRQRGDAPAARDSRANRGQQQPRRQDSAQPGHRAKKPHHRQGQPDQRQHESSPDHGRTAPARHKVAAHATAQPEPRPSAARQLLALFGSVGRKAT
ncbi:MAG: DEAD/DEAH box helicase [Betaproteobacteria bacterium]|nr:DEAD/DEAH box helicase [Betaproteobacteria bacterium]MDH3435679.1 DEAD/DEAH box helicase [Betaproteobacteria bacterium]